MANKKKKNVEPVLAEVSDLEHGKVELSPSDLDEVELITAVAELDLEAALAYRTAVKLVTSPELKKQFRKFEADHTRHVVELNKVLSKMEGSPIELPQPDDDGLLGSLIRLSAVLGDSAVVLALINQEQTSNLTYDIALQIELPPAITKVLERGAAAVAGHLEWLADKDDEMAEAEGDVDPEA